MNMPAQRYFRGVVFWLILLVSLGWFFNSAHGSPDFDRLLESFTHRWGTHNVPRFNRWRNLVQSITDAPDADRLKKVNDFFNREIQFGEDIVVWGQNDYWATPLESLGKGAGDCEDYVIAKYFTLRESGVTPEKLRLIYVRVQTGSGGGAPPQAHMVLAYYAQPDAEPLVLDNLIGQIRPASRRPDLLPVFSFNSDGVFVGISGQDTKPSGSTGRLSVWEDLLKRARAEGFK